MKKFLFGFIGILSWIIIMCLPIAVSVVGLIVCISILVGNTLVKRRKKPF